MRELSVLQRPVVVLTALVLIALALYQETVLSLVELWTRDGNPTYHHGLLVVGICAFLCYRRWVDVGHCVRVQPSSSAVGSVLLVSFL